jgi:phosphatidylglycerophosphatase A
MPSADISTRPVLALTIATVFGIGYVRYAPGTFGSAAGLLLWAVLPQSTPVHAAAILIIFAVGSWCGTVAERHFRGTDPGPVVIDEVMGMLITLFMHPVGWLGAMAAFFLFRAFDILKPYPADRLEHLPGGLGVMADDGMAAIYANLALWALLSFIRWIR